MTITFDFGQWVASPYDSHTHRLLLLVLSALFFGAPLSIAQNPFLASQNNDLPTEFSSNRDHLSSTSANSDTQQSSPEHASLPARISLPDTSGRSRASVRPFSKIGLGAHLGLGGIGFDIASPLSNRLNVRAGMDFFNYSDRFTDQGADVGLNLQLRSAHVSLDFFPVNNWFHASPLLVFANNTDVRANIVVPPDSAITLNGADYISDPADPLRGGGSIGFRKVAPGLTVGVGNLVPRSRKHLNLLAETGFYYVGQPVLKVNFTGSACNASLDPSIGCQSVNQDSSFQGSLAGFTARIKKNLQYAQVFPILSFGMSYSF